MTRDHSDHPPRFSLTLYQVGDLPAEQSGQIADHLTQCADCRSQLEQMRADVERQAEAADRQWNRIKARVEATAEPQGRVGGWLRHWRWLGAGTLAAAGMATFVVLLVGPGTAPGPPTEMQTAYKGVATLHGVVKRGDAQSALRDGQVVQPADRIRFTLTASRPGFATLFSLDSAHDLSPLYPASDPRRDPAPWKLNEAGPHLLPDAVALDDTPGAETFVYVFSPRPFDRNQVHREVRRLLRSKGRRGLSAAALGLAGAKVGAMVVHKPAPVDHRR